jgi:hypothetical protein
VIVAARQTAQLMKFSLGHLLETSYRQNTRGDVFICDEEAKASAPKGVGKNINLFDFGGVHKQQRPNIHVEAGEGGVTLTRVDVAREFNRVEHLQRL